MNLKNFDKKEFTQQIYSKYIFFVLIHFSIFF